MPLLLKADAVPEAVEKLGRKTPVASALSAREWEDMPLALRENAQFSAKVESVRLMRAIQDKARAAIAAERLRISEVGHRLTPAQLAEAEARGETVLMTRDRFMADLSGLARQEGLGATGPHELEDITGHARLGLIFDMQTRMATEYARWKVGQEASVLDAWPAQRLVRVYPREVPRGFRKTAAGLVPVPGDSWEERWDEAGSIVGWEGAAQTEMVARKDSPIWTQLSRFGTPWPPFDYMSGMGLEDVDRATAQELGLIGTDEQVAPPEVGFNEELEASVDNWQPHEIATLKSAFGDQVQEENGRVAWQGSLLRDFFDGATAGNGFKDSISIGEAQNVAIAKASAKGMDISGVTLRLSADDLRHAVKRHGVGSPDRNPIERKDVEVLPHVWRDPDAVERGAGAALVFKKKINGKLVFVEAEASPERRTAQVKTIRRES